MSSIPFFCAVCGQAQSATPSLAGELMECIRCERLVPVPGFPLAAKESGCAPVYSPEILSIDVVFLCKGCNAKLVVDGRMEGRDLDCPQCQARVKMPVWSHRTTAPPASRSSKKSRPHLTPDEVGFLTGVFQHSAAR